MKENKVVINILLIIIMILVVIACVVIYMCFTNDVEIIVPKQENTLFTVENYPRIDGSKETLPLAKEFKADFTQKATKEVEVEYSETTYKAYLNLINGSADLILVTKPSEDVQSLAKNKGIELEMVPIVKDALVFLANKDNPVENLTLRQIQNIYSGKIRNWSDVGGKDSKIRAFQKPDTSTSQIAMLDLVMNGTKMTQPITETIPQNTADIVGVIADYDNSPTSIGYSYKYYATTIYTNDTMKLLSVDGIEPTYENIQTGLYDLQTVYYAVIKKEEPEDSNTRKLLNAMVSERGQKVAKEAGYVQNY